MLMIDRRSPHPDIGGRYETHLFAFVYLCSGFSAFVPRYHCERSGLARLGNGDIWDQSSTCELAVDSDGGR